MKRIITLILVCSLILTGCGQIHSTNPIPEKGVENNTEPLNQEEGPGLDTDSGTTDTESIKYNITIPEYNSLSDPELLRYVEDNVYAELVTDLNSDRYFVENIDAVYVSKEYLEELAFNSQSNIFFGYSLEDLDKQFDGTRYIFTLGDDGTTIVQAFDNYDDTYEQAIKNVAIGSGVILVCVTVSVVSAGAGAPAISMIFAASAKTGATFALSSGTLGFAANSIITGIQTHDVEAAIKAGALAGSEAFKWGAISGAISGGASEAIALHGATLNGLTMNEAAMIQKESGYPLDVIKQFQNMDQYEICKNAELTPQMINGKTALVRNIDLNFKDELGRTNLERMKQGLAALDPATGEAYQLHHIGQEVNSTLAMLTEAEHMQGGNNLIWHDPSIQSAVHNISNNWDAQRQAFWKAIAQALS